MFSENKKWNAFAVVIVALVVFGLAQQIASAVTLPTEDGIILWLAETVVWFFTLTPVAIVGGLVRNVTGFLYNYWDANAEYDDTKLYTTWIKFEAGVLFMVPILEAFAPTIPNITLVTVSIIFVADTAASVLKRLYAKPS